ncbi:hypothetical protein T4C_2214 [Trichinella pseudospiralis]|uniref:Uncharacterized protein n=1 Tax=Trichinella pseudospiralis TaxID=6337 RepID=A0A0V1GBU4_TRIPS|nr:hypothetical protein T4C_2214 [Trichinella pseudospiralis]
MLPGRIRRTEPAPFQNCVQLLLRYMEARGQPLNYLEM